MPNLYFKIANLYKAPTIIVCLCLAVTCFSQQKTFEQVLAENYAYTKQDTIKLDKLRRIASTYRNTDGKKSLLYSDSALILAKQLNLPYHLAGAYWGKGITFTYQGQNEDAIANFEAGLNVLNKKCDRREMELKANLLTSKGKILNSTGEHDKALELYKKSLDIGYTIKDTSIILSTTNSIGVLYMAIADWQTALKYMRKLATILESDSLKSANKNYKIQGVYLSSLTNTGNILGILKRYDDAIPPLKKALETAQRWNVGVQYWSAANILTEIYYKMRNYPRSFYFAVPTYQYHLKTNMPEDLSMDYKNLARLVRDAPDSLLIKNKIDVNRRYDSTIDLLNKGIKLADDLNSNALREDLMEEMSITYERFGNYPKAYEYYKKFKVIHDSLSNTNQQQGILINDMQYQFGRQKDSLKFSQELIQTKLQLQVAANRQQAELATKEKEIQHLAFLKTRAELQTEQQEKKEQQKQLNLSEKEKQLQQSQLLSLSQEKELAKFKLKQQWLYSLIGIVLLGLIALYFLYRNRIQRLRLKNELIREKTGQQLKEAELHNKMNDITLTALRSQMNPHFIFNCLNSIKLYTEEKNNEAASEYLSKFSKLIRNMLDSTRSDRVSLSAELESIKLYIEMEAMRFKDKLQYAININKNVDADYIEVPPLLIQPYIENAIWHGLMHKEKGGRIDVDISQSIDEEALLITITDDGIGRVASELLKSKSAMKHKSYGTKVTGERIALINEKYKAGANVEIIDLYKDDKPTGTQVTIKLPLE